MVLTHCVYVQKYDAELFKLALPCLSAVAGALPPDYMESNYVAMMEKQSSMDAEGNFNPQPVDTSKLVTFSHALLIQSRCFGNTKSRLMLSSEM